MIRSFICEHDTGPSFEFVDPEKIAKFVQDQEDYEYIQSQTSDDKKKKAAHNLEAGKKFQQHVFATATQKRALQKQKQTEAGDVTEEEDEDQENSPPSNSNRTKSTSRSTLTRNTDNDERSKKLTEFIELKKTHSERRLQVEEKQAEAALKMAEAQLQQLKALTLLLARLNKTD